MEERVDVKSLIAVPAAVVGLAASFFFAGPALIADGPLSERMVAVALSVVVFGIVGLAIGALYPSGWKWSGAALAAAALPVPILLGREMLLLAVIILLSDAAAGLSGAWLGALSRRRRGRR